MSFWWVSQNKTWSHEVGGGFMWAPKVDERGNTHFGWAFMLKVQPGDVIFSFEGAQVRAVGVAYSTAYSSKQPPNFGKNGETWLTDGWRVDVDYVLLDAPFRPSNFMSILAPLLPEKYSPLQDTGRGNQAYLFPVPDKLGSTILSMVNVELPPLPTLSLEDIYFDHVEQDIIADKVLRETEKASLVLSRRGQGLFRSRVSSIERACRVTGLESEKFLIASHIKPWKLSDNNERLDGNNGLFLSPHVDKLFDSGMISFTARGAMLVSEKLDLQVLDKWGIDPTKNYGRFNSDQAYFLAHHQQQSFKA